MLNWWAGRDGQRCSLDDTNVPATPGPVFAARAFKSAFFGTPDPNEDTVIPAQIHSTIQRTRSETRNEKMGAAGRRDESPTKKGILMTPGTITRRKTVSFGADTADNDGQRTGRSGLPGDCPGKFPSPWTPKTVDLDDPRSGSKRDTSLNRRLQQSRSDIKPTTEPVAPVKSSIGDDRKISPTDSDIDAMLARASGSETIIIADEADADMTIDLGQPHSQSGRYWKAQHDRYHDEAVKEMKKLLQYKEMAKSYATKKDGEALNLVQKLREEQHKVYLMEQRLAQLTDQAILDRLGKPKSELEELAKDLAKQTALTAAYKDEVTRFQLDIQRQDTGESKGNGSSPRTTNTIMETSQELKKAREQLSELKSLGSEIHALRLSSSAAERKANKLQEENAKLLRELQTVRERLEQSEDRRNIAETYAGDLEKKYDNMKQLAKVKRDEAEDLLKKSHDEKNELRKELRTFKRQSGMPGSGVEVQPVVAEALEEADGLRIKGTKQLHANTRQEYKSRHVHAQGAGLGAPESVAQPRKVTVTSTGAVRQPRPTAESVSKPSAGSRQSRAATSILAEITNAPISNKAKLDPFSITSSPLRTSPPVLANGVGEFSKPSTAMITRSIQTSVQPITSSKENVVPTVAPKVEPMADVTVARKRPVILTPRKILPPERAAAARARLEQRNAGRKRAQVP